MNKFYKFKNFHQGKKIAKLIGVDIFMNTTQYKPTFVHVGSFKAIFPQMKM